MGLRNEELDAKLDRLASLIESMNERKLTVTTHTHPEHTGLASLMDYAHGEGWTVRVRELSRKPKHWTGPVSKRWNLYGHADKGYSGQPHAEAAYVTGADLDMVAIALAHELGHCEGFAETRWDYPTNKELDALEGVEQDAWHRGLRIAGECGIEISREGYLLAALALDSHAGIDNPTARYLLSEALPLRPLDSVCPLICPTIRNLWLKLKGYR